MGKQTVSQFLIDLTHPLKPEVLKVREIIKAANAEINEEVKWNAPSFNYRGEYLVTFNLRKQDAVHLVFHNTLIPEVESDLLEGEYVDRRMLYLKNMDELNIKEKELTRIIQDLIKLINQEK